jgi:hypothetical protein
LARLVTPVLYKLLTPGLAGETNLQQAMGGPQ